MDAAPFDERDDAAWIRAAGYRAEYARLLDVRVDGDEVTLLVDTNGDDRHVDIVAMRRGPDGSWAEESTDMDVELRRLVRYPSTGAV